MLGQAISRVNSKNYGSSQARKSAYFKENKKDHIPEGICINILGRSLGSVLLYVFKVVRAWGN